MLAAFIVLGVATPSSAADPCGAGSNPIVCENSKAGTPRSVWDTGRNGGDSDILGFATQMSVPVGGTIDFKINAPGASNYTITIYRTGWYNGDGARQIATVTPSATLPQTQPACVYDNSVEETDCGNWGNSASWSVPTDAVSGVYVADLYRADEDGASQILFVVTDPNSTSDILVKTSDATWQAYNSYGGADFYMGGDNGRAYALSYNRPIITRGGATNHDNYFSDEYPLVEFLEENGYDVSYTTDIDTALDGAGAIEKHKVFISSGHDEYWFNQERANVEAARDAGVNLQFLSGNEVYWDTRPTPSIDGSNTPNRTITSYKETWSNAKIDPSTQWTGTWRDPRFASKANGGSYPEEALSGTQYMSNYTDLPVTVTQSQGKEALWANTGLGSMTGASTALADHTIGYESDEDVDNGFRQSGLLYLSTTTGAVPQYLQDYGSVVAAGTTTHHMTLYRASSGALVMSAGSIQFNWGLNSNHDVGSGVSLPDADPRMQQFEVNMLAFMGVQPTTLMSGLVASVGITDHTPPTATVTSPAPGSSIPNGNSVTVQGTASDVGGVVAAVEVSVDGGETWHMATGTTSWSYSYIQHGIGSEKVLVRAVDDSANYAATPVEADYTVTGPYTALGNATPTVADSGDPDAEELGLQFTATQDGVILGARFYKSALNTGTHVAHLWDTNGNLLATATFVNESASGWQSVDFPSAVSVGAGQSYVVSYTTSTGHYAADGKQWDYRGVDAGPLTIAGGYGAQPAGLYGRAGYFPTSSYQNTDYYVDAIFSTVDTSALTATSQWPLPGSTSVPTTSTISAVMSRAIDQSTLAFSVTDQNGASVAGTTSYDPSTRTATFSPSSPLNGFVKYSVAVTATSSAGGVALSSGGTWSFTTVKPNPTPGVCPCGLYSDSTVPAELQDADNNAVTLGVRFTPSVNGTITGVSFYKGAGNTGTHTGSLWTASGTELASGTFTNESTSGWQTLTFSTPVQVTAGTQYVAAYRTPVGLYSVTPNGFKPPLSVGPLTADSGMYNYTDAYPGTTSTASYLVDVVFQPAAASISVTSETPSSGAAAVSTSSPITLSTSSALATGYTVTVESGTTVIPGVTTLSSDGMTVTFTPSAALPTGAQITVTVANLSGTNGASLPDQSWSFVTAADSGGGAGDGGSGNPGSAVTLFGNQTPTVAAETTDASPVEVGTRFTTSTAGAVTGIRFYKGATNTGTHVGHLWSPSGALLATAVFTNESANGWQYAAFPTPVELTPGAQYTVSYLAPNGNYSSTSSYFTNPVTSGPLTAPVSAGAYLYGATGGMPKYSWQASNYFVDVTFVADSTSTPSSTPTPTPTPTSTPSPTQTPGASLPTGAETLFAGSTPASTNWADSAAAQVGVRFTSSAAGQVSGIYYYRATGDTASDTVYLWTATGTQLATATVSAATAPGWVYAAFDSPVAISAGTEYRASYYSTSKHYAVTTNGLSSSKSNGQDLTALGGAYVYGTTAPTNTAKHNYWVDIAFTPGT